MPCETLYEREACQTPPAQFAGGTPKGIANYACQAFHTYRVHGAFPLLMHLASLAAESGPRMLLKLASYDDGPGGKVTFQINRLDIRAPSAFLTLGEIIPGTHLKLTKFNKHPPGGFGESDDVSQLELVDTQTGMHAILIMDRIVSIPFSDDPGLPKTK